jgi:hypothetical protein
MNCSWFATKSISGLGSHVGLKAPMLPTRVMGPFLQGLVTTLGLGSDVVKSSSRDDVLKPPPHDFGRPTLSPKQPLPTLGQHKHGRVAHID